MSGICRKQYLLFELFLFCAFWLFGSVVCFEKSPKIITKDGNLIFEAGLNRNISIRLNGNSRININDELDLIDLMLLSGSRLGGRNSSMVNLIDSSPTQSLADDVAAMKLQIFGVTGLDRRLRRLQNRTRNSNDLMRRTQTRLRNVETRVQALFTKLRDDNCKNNPCENGGTCIDLFEGFICKCTKQFEGPTCSQDVNECALYTGTDLGCQNGGQCINQFGGYSCICNVGWFGIHCTQRKADCMQSSGWELCGHGTCINANDNFGYKCICDQGWKSNGLTPACNVDVNECTESHPPCASKCINLQGSFTCAPCAAGLTGNGITCRDLDECASQNGGCSVRPFVPCINTYGSFHCGECPIGWNGDGKVCTRNSGGPNSCSGNNICHPAATCAEVSSTVVCTCPVGLVGNGIGPNGCALSSQNRCSSSPCLNGGTCLDNGASFTCVCPVGFRAPNCERVNHPCSPNPCKNNGGCISRGNTFLCLCAAGYTGRNCDTQRSRCGGLLASQTGNLKYPLNSFYEHNSQCSWVIQTNATKVLNVTFVQFDLEDSAECRFDWLQINDGRTAASQLIGRFCGMRLPLGGSIISTRNQLYLWFRSDNSSSREGFELNWTSIDPVCGGLIEFSSHGTIASPGSPGNYPPNRDCRWHLKAPNDKRIKLTFFSLQIEQHTTCNHDYIEITDVVSSARLEIFCNSSSPAPFMLPSSEIEIHFHSDNQGSDTGFQIHYSTVESIPGCGGVFTAKSGIINSPEIVQQSMSCEYSIKLAKGLKIRMEFTEFNMGPDDCVEIFDLNPEEVRVLVGRWCGDTTPPVYKTLFNEVQLQFKSKGGIFTMRYTSVCSFTFESESGTIASPNYPEKIVSEQMCTYEILADPNKGIALDFIDFDISDLSFLASGERDCTYSYLKIIDGYQEEPYKSYCHNNTPTSMISSSNMVRLKFRMGHSSTGRGFKANYTIISTGGAKNCGGIFKKPNVEIRLPSTVDGTYESDLECRWTLFAPFGYGIQLFWLSFQLEESTDCLYDYIEIYDSASISNNEPLGRYCGYQHPPTIQTLSNVLTMKFVSDSSLSSDGFVAKFNFVDVSNVCGGHIFSSSGEIKSPLWPDNYSDNMNCTWVINVPQGRQIELRVKSIDLENSINCEKDWLEIRNGASWNSSLIGKFCGSTAPQRIPSFTNHLYMNFHSDGNANAKGFQVSWDATATGCGGYLNTDRGTITSPNYPLPYSNDAQCEWLIRVNEGSTIHLTIEDLEMEILFSCAFDHLEIYDGRSTTDGKLARICELVNGPVAFVTTGSMALIRFTSDSTSTERGFSISYYTNCTRTLTAIRGVVENPGFGVDSYHRGEVNCSWTIQAPHGNRIALQFVTFNQDTDVSLNESKHNNNVLYLFENGSNRLIQSASSFNSTSDTVQLVLNSSSVDFRLEYVMVGCLDVFHRPSGEFTSLNYPNGYPNGVECRWEIQTDYGSSIELSLFNVDLEETTNCTNDGIEISYHTHANHSLQKYCGKRDNITVISSGHRMFIRFYSDKMNNGKGFNAKYRTLTSECGGKITTNQGVILSPNYPQNYRPNLNCEWLIEVSNHHTMTLTIEELDVEEYGSNCEMDSLEAYDGGEIQDGALMFRKCGQEVPTPNNWTTTTNRALITFNTDYDTEFKGFKITFVENCGQRVIVDDTVGRIRISKLAQTQVDCVWTLVSEDVTQHVIFTTTHVQLSPLMAMSDLRDGDCQNRIKGVTIFDGVDVNSPVRQKFCIHHPEAVISHGHAITISVSLNVISEFEGFYSLMDSTCGGQFNSMRGKFSSPYYPASYPVNIECVWTITANEGNAIALTIQSLDIEQSDDCNGDYLEVRKGSEKGVLLGVFCGSQVPPTIESANELWIKFSSDNDNVGKGFVAEYSYVRHNEINGTSGVIESPKYPTKFLSLLEYSWRITVRRDHLVMLTIDDVTDTNIPYIKIYDGYSDIGAEIQFKDLNTIQSNTNILFFTATRGPFRFKWNQISKESAVNNRTAAEKAAICGNELLTVGDVSLIFNSLGYPNGYQSNLNCSWTIMAEDRASHVELKFLKVDLEDMIECMMDYVSISSSNDMQHWKQLDKLCKKKTNTDMLYKGTPFLKLNFITDYGVNKTGFSSLITSRCGSNLTGPSALVNISRYTTGSNFYSMECIWQIHVQPGRRIRITFPESQFASSNDTTGSCRSYILLKNGMSEDSPFLGIGKYCQNNIINIPETSSNQAYVKFVRTGFQRFQRLAFHYEEVMHDCSKFIRLEEQPRYATSKVIQSPNYPNIPNPHSECIWTITAPINRVIAVDFSGRFDLALLANEPKERECDREFLQINDGGTELSPLIGRFCGSTLPDTQYSTGNILRIKYFTDVSEPHIGFNANVSLGQCGGSYYTAEGVILSPTQMVKGRGRSKEVYCDYNIIMQEGYTLNLTIDKINLPQSSNCSEVSHLEMHMPSRGTPESGEVLVENEEEEPPEIICGDTESVHYVLDLSRVRLRYKIINSQAGHSFRITYKSIGSRCSETIESERGILQSPGYPNGVKIPTYCFWKVRVPKGRRIKIEFLDFDTGFRVNVTGHTGHNTHPRFRGRITFANDFLFSSIITRVSNDPPATIYSTDNTMAINSFVIPFSRHRGFKLRFSSDEESPYCQELFDFDAKSEGIVRFEKFDSSPIFCNYDINVRPNETLAIHVANIQKNGSDVMDLYFCQQTSPIVVKVMSLSEKIRPDLLCRNDTDPVLRLPFPISLALSANTRNKLKLLELQYKVHKCGGLLTMEHTDIVQINQPEITADSSYGQVECAWVIVPNSEDDDDEQFEVQLSVNFKNKCDQQFLIVYNGPTQDSPHLGRFCNQVTASNLVADHGLFVEYYSASYDQESKFNVTTKLGSGCGGRLTYPYRRINFRDQYRNNIECIWTVSAENGYHIGLSFVDRFFIESSPQCTKDYVQIQEKSEESEWRDIRKLCGRESPPVINSTGGEIRLIFRSDGDVVGDGFTAVFSRNCGGIFYADDEKRQLSSPNYPNQYDPRLFCNYTITPSNPKGSGIIVRFLDFKIEDSIGELCLFDNVTIITTEETGEQTSTVICGRDRKREIRSRNPISIIFQSDISYSTKGFLFEYSNDLCGGVVTNSTIIETPRQQEDGKYPSNMNCRWNLTAPLGYKIVIKFEFLDFESYSNCPYDYVQIFAGRYPASEQRLAKFCGNLTGKVPPISIPKNEGIIHSISDGQDSSAGFRAVVSFIPMCDRQIFLSEQNSSYLLDAFAGSYQNNLDCSYVFRTSPGRQIRIEFSTFHVEDSDGCSNDFLEMRDGAGPFADQIGQFCGHIIPPAVTSSRTAAFVRFVTDSSDTSSGFSATIKSLVTVCGGPELQIKSNQSITISSPGNNGRYLPNLNCYWRIRGGNNIHLQFEKLDLQEPNANGTCDNDYLKLYNHESFEFTENALGADFLFNGDETQMQWNFITPSLQHIYCGHNLPDDYFANNKEMYIKFKTDSTIEKAGFKIIASDASGCFKNYTSTQGRINIDSTADCDVYINAPQNYSISLYYNEFFFADTDCNNEYIEVFDAKTNKSLQKICEYASPKKSLFSNLNHLRLRFKNSGYYTKMDITYLASDAGPGCGGSFYNYEGVFTNPYYPMNVRNNSNCRWNIRVPNNLRVFLRFDVFDLGAKTTCHSDYMQIIEHEEGGKETIVRTFCGEDNPKVYMGRRSYLTVYFHKTVNYDGTGWMLRFSAVHQDYQIPNYFLE